MPSRTKAVSKKKAAKPAAKKPASAQKSAARPAAKKPAAAMAAATAAVAVRPAAAPFAMKPPAKPAPFVAANGTAPAATAKPARPMSAGQVATAQQAEERRKAATRKLFARIRSLEAILGADLRKRGSLLLSQAVDQWYAEATSTTATDVSITNSARAVISQL